ncbi:hypothetical protein Pcinc_028809 [Petrolisthes cinctipes]|uniref:CCN TSP1 domain-containing protein n=1 Tax=Petrolisthes cinctipes TaxID=88211 RepID=A0AAE1K6T8_PETCI|nr:hypothetical protein Pcinc_028809 [Petrolisthes cinctipes]
MGPPECDRVSGKWSPCSVQSCGTGVSIRWSTDNTHCHLANQTRLCQLRPCNYRGVSMMTQPHLQFQRKHHIRRGHQCKATLRSEVTVRLRVGWCISERRYKPKMCASCPTRCCSIYSSTTISIPFLCPLHANTNLEAVPYARHPAHQQVTTHAPSVYEMMDEGQPVSEEAVLSYPQPQQMDQGLSYDNLVAPNDNPYIDDDDDWDDSEKEFQHENLWMEDDILYDDIKRENYETIHYQVEWILRCKCAPTCATQDLASDSPTPPPLTDPSRHDTLPNLT